MVALSSLAMLSQSTQCLETSHSRHVFVECSFWKDAWFEFEFGRDVVHLNLNVVRHI